MSVILYNVLRYRKCFSCGDVFELKHDEDGWDLNHWLDKLGHIYCDQCFYELYTKIEEKVLIDLVSNWKSVRERAKEKLDELYLIWGIRS